MATQVGDDPEIGDFAAGGKSAKSGKIKIVMLLFAVMAIEGAVLYFVLPRPQANGDVLTPAAAAVTEEPPNLETVEVAVGSFRCTNSVAAKGRSYHITFELSVTVAKDQAEPFATAVKSIYKARIRQAVLQVARSSSVEDLDDPEFTVLRRQIKEEVNKVLRKSYINEVIISDWDKWDQ